MNTLGIYIQVPFCASKCSFCNFSSQVAPRGSYERYSQALCQEIEHAATIHDDADVGPAIFAFPADTVYIGGGTPSLLEIPRLARVVGKLQRHFTFTPQREFTLEVTPGSADEHFLAGLQELGVNRLSIGAQSFQEAELRSVGRLHSASETEVLVKSARRQGLSNVNLDLIAGLPHQTTDTWQRTLHQVLALRPEHVSIYLFEADEKSRLGNEVLRHGNRYHAASVPDEDWMADAYEGAREILHREGYLQYEISNFALPGWESMHNRKYWRLEPYLGFGAGAHSFDGCSRWKNEEDIGAYEAKLARRESPIRERRMVPTAEQIEEFFFLGLRQREGVRLDAARSRWGSRFLSPWANKLRKLEVEGWIERRGESIRLTERALLISNEIFQEFVAE